jgi:hypothetical protein
MFRLSDLLGIFLIVVPLFATGCSQKSAGSTVTSAPASKVPNVAKEDQLNTFEISPRRRSKNGRRYACGCTAGKSLCQPGPV